METHENSAPNDFDCEQLLMERVERKDSAGDDGHNSRKACRDHDDP